MVAKGPAIEGSLADPLWQKAPPLRLLPVPGQDGKLATTVRVLFDATHLYAAIECEEPDRALQAKARDRDSDVWADDCVELYVLPHPRVGYRQIAINPLGTIFDQAFAPGRSSSANRGWNANVKVAVSVQPGEGWKIALSVPYRDLGAPAGNDQTWRFNATRLRKPRGDTPTQEYTWAALPSPEFHQPEAFGAIEHVNIPEEPGGATSRAGELRSGLQWSRLPQVRGARRLFPHPLDPDVVWCATTNGLLVTHDDGQAWTPVECVERESVERKALSVERKAQETKDAPRSTLHAPPPDAPRSTLHAPRPQDAPRLTPDPQGLGEVTCLAVSARNPATVCLGTEGRGLFLSADAGKTWKRLGKEGDEGRGTGDGANAEGRRPKAESMPGTERRDPSSHSSSVIRHSSLPGSPASDHIEWVDFCPSDPTRRTLLATHGVAAPGVSLSRDLGATWEVLGKDRFLARFAKQAQTIVAVGSMTASEGKVWGIHRSGTDGLRWEETVRGIRPAAVVAGRAPWQFFVSTLDGAILRSLNDGGSWEGVVRSEGSAWTSLFFTSGPTAQAQILAAYDPYRQGLCLSRHGFSNGLGDRESRGLYVGPYVKSGATCVANANGSTYYIALNNALWVGRWAPAAEGPAVLQARCLPCSVGVDDGAVFQARSGLHAQVAAIAAGEPAAAPLRSVAAAARALREQKAEMKFTVQARVHHPRGPREIKSVAVDTSELGGSRATPLFDDGGHNDEKAGDGLYGATVPFSPALLQQEGFRETRLLTVTATDASGASSSWPAVVHLPRALATASLMHGGYDCDRTEGPVTVRMAHGEGVLPKSDVLRFTATGPGPWRAAWVMPTDGVNSAGYRWLSFHIKGDANQELFVHLVDHHRMGHEGFFDEPHFGAPVPLLAGGHLKAITPTYQEVRVPMGDLLPRGTYFLRWHTAGIGLSAPKAARPATYHVDLVELEP